MVKQKEKRNTKNEMKKNGVEEIRRREINDKKARGEKKSGK